MWPTGHVALGYLLYTLTTRNRSGTPPATGPTLAVVVGSLLPDLVDKPLAWGLGVLPTGRTLTHSLLGLLPLCLLLYAVAWKRAESEVGVALVLGALAHTLVDALPALWRADTSARFLLWPLLAVEPYETRAPTLLELLSGALGDLLIEVALFTVAVGVWYRDGCPGLPRAGRSSK